MKQYAALDDTIYLWFASNDTSGSGGDGASPAADVRLAGAAADAAPVYSPTPALLTHANYPAGSYEIAITASAANGFATGNTYAVFCTLAIDSQNPTGFVGSFDLKPVESDVTQWLGTAAATPTVAGVPEVDITHLLGTAWLAPGVAGTPDVNAKLLGATAQTGRDIGASVLLSTGTGAGQLDFTSGIVKSNLTQILAHLLTQTGTQLADGFEHFFDVGTPTGTIDSLPAAAPNAAGGLPISAAGGLDLDTKLANTNEITAARMGTLTDWINGGRLDLILDIIAADTTTDIPALLLKYIQLLARSDAAIATDNATELTAINADGGSGAGDFSNQSDAVEAIRDRGDSAWTTGAGGSDRLLMVDTTIATLASQTSFTLTAGSADDDAYNNCTIVIEDASTATQKAVGIISDYTGGSKTVTLKYDPAIFAMATTDKVYILAENALKATLANRQLNVAADGDIAGNIDGSVASVAGHTAQTGDSYAIVNNASYGNAKLIRSTAPANTLDVSATGEAGLDFANIKNATGAHTLTNITVPTVSALTDKSGFGLSTASINLIWDDLISGITQVGSIGKLIADNLNATMTSRAPSGEYNTQMGYIPSNLGDVPIKSELDSDHGAGSWATATGFSTHSAANVWSVGTRALTDKSGFALSAAGANLILKDSTFALAMADAMWDEILTGATHNIATSAGRRVREIGAYAIQSGTAQAGSSNSITLAATADAVDGTYNRNLIILTDNTGVGQTRTIVDYNGTSKVAVIDRDWRTSPDATTEYQITPDNTPLVVDQGVAQEGTSTTIKLRAYASSTNDIYLCNVVAIIAGTGRGQARLVGAYNGTTKVVTICGDNWVTNPDNTSVYVLMPYGTTCTSCIGTYALGLIKSEADDALTDYDPPTRTEATSDKDAIITEVNANETKIDALQTDSTAIKAKTDNLPSGIGKNEALAKFDVFMVLSSNHVTGATGKPVTGTISKDGGAFAAITNTITEVSDGMYTIASGFTQTEMNADTVTLKFTADDCDTRIITIHTS